MQNRFLPSVFLTGLLTLQAAPAQSQEDKFAAPTFDAVERITDRILGKELEIYNLNTRFRLDNGRDSPGKRMRVLIYQNINYIGTCVGLMNNVIYNFAEWARLPIGSTPHANEKNLVTLYANALTNPSKTPLTSQGLIGAYNKAIMRKPYVDIPTAIQLGSTLPRLIGKAILISGYLYETGLELKEHGKEKSNGSDVKTNDLRVLALKKEVEHLIEVRQNIISRAYNLTSAQKGIVDNETLLLSTGLQMSLSEYLKLHAESIARSTYNRINMPLTIAKKSDGCFMADVNRVVGAADQKGGRYSSIASIGTTSSGAMSAWDPVVELGSRVIAGKLSANGKFSMEMGKPSNSAVEEFRTNLEDLDKRIKVLEPGGDQHTYELAKARHGFYNNELSVYEDMDYVDQRRIKDQHKHDKHSLIMHQMYGTSKYSRGAWLIAAGILYAHSPRRNTIITADAGIINFTGSAIRLADTLRTDSIEITRRRELKADRSVNSFILQGRISTLQDMGAELAARKGPVSQEAPAAQSETPLTQQMPDTEQKPSAKDDPSSQPKTISQHVTDDQIRQTLQ